MIDLIKLQEKFDKLFTEETIESFEQFVKNKKRKEEDILNKKTCQHYLSKKKTGICDNCGEYLIRHWKVFG